MATAAEKKAAEEAAKAKAEAEKKAADGKMSILEALELAQRGKRVRREGWSKALQKHYITINRGETLPTLSNGKHGSPYTPSIVDVMTKDWIEIN